MVSWAPSCFGKYIAHVTSFNSMPTEQSPIEKLHGFGMNTVSEKESMNNTKEYPNVSRMNPKELSEAKIIDIINILKSINKKIVCTSNF